MLNVKKKPLAIVDPKSNKALEFEKPTSSTNSIANDESTADSKKSKDDISESQRKREAFRKDFAESLNNEPQTEKVWHTFHLVRFSFSLSFVFLKQKGPQSSRKRRETH